MTSALGLLRRRRRPLSISRRLPMASVTRQRRVPMAGTSQIDTIIERAGPQALVRAIDPGRIPPERCSSMPPGGMMLT